MAPKYKNSDAGNSDMPKRRLKGLHLNVKVKVLDLLRKEKNVLRSTVRTDLLSVKLCKRKKKFHASFTSHLKLQNLQLQYVIIT